MMDKKIISISGLNFHHIGYVVPNIEKYLNSFTPFVKSANVINKKFIDYEQKVTVLFLKINSGPLIELVEPKGDGSPVSGFLEKNPFGGLHHLAFEGTNFVNASKALKQNGYRRVTNITTGFEGRRISFYLPRVGATSPLMELISRVEK